MKAALIENGVVVAIVTGDVAGGVAIPDGLAVAPGWLYLDGQFVAPAPLALDAIKAPMIERIDAKAAAIYSRWTRFEAEYRAREAAAQAFKDGGYQGESGLYVSSFAEPAGLSARDAADAILAQAAALRAAQDALASLRMRKYEIARAADIAAAQALADEIVASMDDVARGIA